jgi:peptide/nickel transport system permease protein
MKSLPLFLQKWKKRNESRLKDYRFMLHLFRKNPLTMTGLIFLMIIIITGISADFIAPYSPTKINMADALQPPSWKHIFGTDWFGRDIYSRMVYGARITIYLIAVIITVRYAISISVGVLAGYFRGVIDEILMRITDIFLAFPSIIMAMALAFVLGPGLTSVIVAITVTGWPWAARLVRSQVIAIREEGYIEATRSLGAGNLRIILFHILPNSIGPIIVQATVSVGWIVLTAASMGFLGVGAVPPTPEWGLMVSQGRTYFLTAPWISLIPGLAILLTVVGANLLGDGLRDVMDPRLRRR